MSSKNTRDPSLVERAKDKWQDRLRKYRRIMRDSEQAQEIQPTPRKTPSLIDKQDGREMPVLRKQ